MTTLLLLFAILSQATAATGTATCRIDLATGSFSWTVDGQAVGTVELEAAEAALELLGDRLEAGDPADSLRAQLGEALLGPVYARIAGCEAWRFQPVEVHGMPGVFGVLPALVLPDSSGDPVLSRHRCSLAWPEAFGRPAVAGRQGEGSLLLAAPFREGLDPARDDPDTLRRALARNVRQVRLIPRNDVGPTALRRALEEDPPSVWWFRGSPDQLAGLQPAFGALPDLVVWNLPTSAERGPAITPRTFGSGGTAPATVIVSVRPESETAMGNLFGRLADELALGRPADVALHEAQLAAVKRDAGILVVSNLVVLGEPGFRSTLRRADWLHRLLHRSR